MRTLLLGVCLLGLLGCKYTAGICDCQYRDECHLKAPWVYRVAVPPPVGAISGPEHYHPGPALIEEGAPPVHDLPLKH